MDVFDAIQTRRSVAKVKAAPVERELVEKVISAGCWAPNHRRTEPWRFVVFEGYGRQKLQEAIFEGTKENNTDLEPKALEEKCIKMAGKVSRAPVIIAVWCAAGRGKKNPPIWEDHAAVSACLQNMSLAAHALGLGSIWRSGAFVDMPAVQKLMVCEGDRFDSAQGDKLMGFFYVGYVDEEYPEPKRNVPEFQNKIQWNS